VIFRVKIGKQTILDSRAKRKCCISDARCCNENLADKKPEGRFVKIKEPQEKRC
jgi:hypothetical protein